MIQFTIHIEILLNQEALDKTCCVLDDTNNHGAKVCEIKKFK